MNYFSEELLRYGTSDRPKEYIVTVDPLEVPYYSTAVKYCIQWSSWPSSDREAVVVVVRHTETETESDRINNHRSNILVGDHEVISKWVITNPRLMRFNNDLDYTQGKAAKTT